MSEQVEKVSDAELGSRLEDCPPVGSRWRRYKGGRYVVVGRAIREADQEPQVLYLADSGITFCRPASEWAGRFESLEVEPA